MGRGPIIETERLLLRPLCLSDAPEVHRFSSEKDVASPTRSIPHPYPDGAAQAWIAEQANEYIEGKLVNFAICVRSDSLKRFEGKLGREIEPKSGIAVEDTQSALISEPRLVGAIGLVFSLENELAEIGYWIGKPHWGFGYATESSHAVIDYGFGQLKLNRIYAQYLSRNPASGRVLAKVGMKYEGCWRQHAKKWGVFEDVDQVGILREDWVRR